jgi:very-short-patch-repair endonuclease
MSRTFVASRLEEQLAVQFRAVNLTPEREYVFHPTRKWRIDFAFPPIKLAIEAEGGIFAGGAHTRGAHFRSDCEKYNAATELGWRVLRYTDREIKTGAAIAQIARIHHALSASP